MTAFESSVSIIVEVVQESVAESPTQQYACACLLVATREKMRGLPYLFDLVIDILPSLLESQNTLTQFFAISCTGNIFSSNNWYVYLFTP